MLNDNGLGVVLGSSTKNNKHPSIVGVLHSLVVYLSVIIN